MNRLIKHGVTPAKPQYQNYDFIKTFHPQIYAGMAKPIFPPEYLTDDGKLFPDQNAEGQPEGCTNYTQSDLARKLGTPTAMPSQLEAVTHANQRGGISIQESLDAARKVLKWFSATYQIKAYSLDYFDSFRLAQSSGIPEKRVITLGIPWFTSWEIAMLQGEAVMKMPTDKELRDIKTNPNSQSWHDSSLDGWATKNGVLVYRDKSWQGTHVGEGGYVYFPREVINTVMAIKGTMAATATNDRALKPQTIDLSLIQYWLSFIRTWYGHRY